MVSYNSDRATPSYEAMEEGDTEEVREQLKTAVEVRTERVQCK